MKKDLDASSFDTTPGEYVDDVTAQLRAARTLS